MPYGKDNLKPGSKQWHRRQAIHYHNSLLGGVGMAKANMNAILNTATTTAEARAIAVKILVDLVALGEQLKARRPFTGDLADDTKEPDHER